MKFDPIKLLVKEHDVIIQAVEIVRMLDGFKEFDLAKYDRLTKSLIVFFKEYGDKIHHYKEDEVLFMEMTNHSDFSQPEIIRELTEHHEIFDEKMERIENYLNKKDYFNSQSLLAEYMEELLDHIAVENDELFVMAQSIFSDREMGIMYHKFKDIDYKYGEDKKFEMEKMIDLIKAELQLSQV